jgi:hypothetical protein
MEVYDIACPSRAGVICHDTDALVTGACDKPYLEKEQPFDSLCSLNASSVRLTGKVRSLDFISNDKTREMIIIPTQSGDKIRLITRKDLETAPKLYTLGAVFFLKKCYTQISI